jgi:ribosomal protein S3
MSAPSASGRLSAGVAKVLSTSVTAPASRARAARAAMSLILRSGLEGVSTKTSAVSGRIAARTAARSFMGTKVELMPHEGRISRAARRKP